MVGTGIRHGQSREWAIHGWGGVYKTSIIHCFTAIMADWVHSATAIWVVHFGYGKTVKSTGLGHGNTSS